VVIRAELAYKRSLISNDHFIVRSLVEQTSRVRFTFHQDIYRLPDETLMLTGEITGTSLNENGRPYVPEILAQLFSQD
jgi:acyl-CoA thioester hydrolase